MNVLVAVDVQVVSSSNANKQENHSRDRSDELIAVTPKCSLGVQKIAFQKDWNFWQ